MATGAAAKGPPKHHLPVTVGVHHNQLGTDAMLRRYPLAPGGHFLWDPSALRLSRHRQASLLPQPQGPAGACPVSLLPAQRVAVAMQEMAKGCAGSVYSPVWVGSSREKMGGKPLAWEVLRAAYL